jgi:cellobiose phosphorylase
MDSVRTSLVVRGSQILLLLHPPFDRSAQDPGYIKGYPPGVRENGGQYTHAAVWIVMALARLGSGDEAAEFFHMLNPVNHARTSADVARYKTEPYVMAGDVYARPPHSGRGGWSWYTGSAGWMYRAGLESILGLRRRGDTFVIDPCIPSSWPEYGIPAFLDSRYGSPCPTPCDGAEVRDGHLMAHGRPGPSRCSTTAARTVQIVLGDHAPRQPDRQRLTMASERP